MKLLEKEIEVKAIELLRSYFDDIPFINILSIDKQLPMGNFRPDYIINLGLLGDEWNLVIEIEDNGQPRIARQAINQLLRYQNLYHRVYPVFIAPFISAKTAGICKSEGVGYLDLAGNCRLCFGQVYIERRGRENKFSKPRFLRSLYSPRAERILRVLLSNPYRPWLYKELANEARVSLGHIHNVKKILLDRELIQVGDSGFELIGWKPLLEEWISNYNFRRNRTRDYYSINDIGQVEYDLARVMRENDINYALTGFSAAARIAPVVRYKRVMAYVDKCDEELFNRIGLKKVTSGANLTVLTPYDEGVFYREWEKDGIRIVSPLQTYLDLTGYRGRGEEAAEAIFRDVIQPQWSQ